MPLSSLRAGPLPAALAALAAVIGFAAAAPVAAATVLSDNTANTTDGTLGVTATDWLAASFVATEAVSSAETLRATLVGSAGSAATLQLYASDASGLVPSDALASFTAATSGSDAYTLTGTALSAGTTYWVVLSDGSGASTWGWTSDGSGSGAGFTAGWASSDDAGSTWFTQSTLYPLQLSVVAGAVPEPAALLLGLAGVAVLLGHRAATRRACPVF